MVRSLTAREVETAARNAGYRSVRHLCLVAGVPASSFSRWRHGHSMPALRSYDKLLNAIAVGAATNTPLAAAHGLGGDAEFEGSDCPD